jgi:hypothetical protein
MAPSLECVSDGLNSEANFVLVPQFECTQLSPLGKILPIRES